MEERTGSRGDAEDAEDAERARPVSTNSLLRELLAETDAVLLDKLRLFEKSWLKRAAVMLFHEDPERLVTGAYVKIGFFRTDSDLRYHDEIHGDLFTQVDRTLDLLLTKYLRADGDPQRPLCRADGQVHAEVEVSSRHFESATGSGGEPGLLT